MSDGFSISKAVSLRGKSQNFSIVLGDALTTVEFALPNHSPLKLTFNTALLAELAELISKIQAAHDEWLMEPKSKL